MWTIIVEFTDRTPFAYGPFATEEEAQTAWHDHVRRWSFPDSKATRITVVPMSTPVGPIGKKPQYRGANPTRQARNEVSIRREAAQIAQRKMWGDG